MNVYSELAICIFQTMIVVELKGGIRLLNVWLETDVIIQLIL